MENSTFDLLEKLTDEECLVQLLLDLNTPIGQRRISEEARYCVQRIINSELLKKLVKDINDAS